MRTVTIPYEEYQGLLKGETEEFKTLKANYDNLNFRVKHLQADNKNLDLENSRLYQKATTVKLEEVKSDREKKIEDLTKVIWGAALGSFIVNLIYFLL
jgi:uncharacterized protein (DUF3084 family)